MERVLAGDILARLGDPRPGVGVRSNGLPDIDWCEVQASPFLMGSDPTKDNLASANEQPQRQVDLPAFRIAKYPITQAQYQTFVEAGGYQEIGYWGEAAATGYWVEGHVKRVIVRQEGGEIKPEEEWASAPAEFGPQFSLGNHPVVGINWYEALAFSQWLTDQLHASGELSPSEFVTLPSESQWEKAARGPLTDGDIARLYPWGNEPDPNRANYTETGLGVTSTVGCFSGGQSPAHCCDMGGNVWEWCGTKWQDNYENYQDDNEVTGYNPRVVRGGAYNISQRSVRCAVRVPVSPSYRAGNLGFRVVISSA
jgi:formylglycine-generating enzyme required for sulfatase activity